MDVYRIATRRRTSATKRRICVLAIPIGFLLFGTVVTTWNPIFTSRTRLNVLPATDLAMLHFPTAAAAVAALTSTRRSTPLPRRKTTTWQPNQHQTTKTLSTVGLHLPAPYTVPSERIFKDRDFVIWNIDHHPSPSLDARSFLEPMGVRYLQFDLSHYCSYFNLCNERKKLKVLTADNMLGFDDVLIPQFHKAYANDTLFQSVDAFVCFDPPSLCELYEQFNRSMIIIAANRYHVGRNTVSNWKRWNEKLTRFSADPKNYIGANNQYDVHYMRYFTGIIPQFIPSYSGYTNAKYAPTNDKYLVSKRRVDSGTITTSWLIGSYYAICSSPKNSTKGLRCPALQRLDQLSMGRYSYGSIAAYKGIVHLPYQVSTMSIFEHYRMNIPLFFPSKRLLGEWDPVHWVVNERTQPWMVRDPVTLPPHESQRQIPSPNDQRNATAVSYWLQFADYYTMPHIQYYDSVEHLTELLSGLTDSQLVEISRKMNDYNEKLKLELVDKWKKIILNAAKYSPNNPH